MKVIDFSKLQYYVTRAEWVAEYPSITFADIMDKVNGWTLMKSMILRIYIMTVGIVGWGGTTPEQLAAFDKSQEHQELARDLIGTLKTSSLIPQDK